MITSEDHNQNGTRRIIAELVRISIYAGEFKVGRGRTKCEDRMRVLCPGAYRNQ